MFKLITIAITLFLNACAFVQHVQVGDVDDREDYHRFEVKLSETAISLSEATKIAAALSQSKRSRRDWGELNTIIKLFQMGPSTGPGVFNDTYAEQLLTLILKVCPSGNISGLTSIREMRRYPVISGQIVKVTGYCRKA